MIKAGIVGITGYGGIELFRILSKHPEVEVQAVTSKQYNEKRVSEIYPHVSHYDCMCRAYTPAELVEQCDVIFTATPHGGISFEYAAEVKKQSKRMIDLSADFRLKDRDVYEAWYKTKHTQADLLKEAVYGLPEIHKEKIRSGWLTANPGCYTTNGILAVIPVIKEEIIDHRTLIIDAKSGVSGGGRKPKTNLLYSEVAGGISAYGVASHRHTPEIEQELSNFSKEPVILTFTPHLVPMVRGILSVSYASLKKKSSEKELTRLYRDFYKDEPFVRILTDTLPCTKYTAGSNFIDIAVKVDTRTDRVIVISSLDNLIKGASGQAVQNMNVMFGFDETMGIDFCSIYP